MVDQQLIDEVTAKLTAIKNEVTQLRTAEVTEGVRGSAKRAEDYRLRKMVAIGKRNVLTELLEDWEARK